MGVFNWTTPEERLMRAYNYYYYGWHHDAQTELLKVIKQVVKEEPSNGQA